MKMQPLNSAASAFEQALQRQVEAGKMASFTKHFGSHSVNVAVSLRAATWFLQSLEGKLESYDQGAVAKGEAVRIEYHYGKKSVVLGTYSIYEVDGFLFGMLAYCRRKWRQAQRKADQAARLRQATEKGGAAL